MLLDRFPARRKRELDAPGRGGVASTALFRSVTRRPTAVAHIDVGARTTVRNRIAVACFGTPRFSMRSLEGLT